MATFDCEWGQNLAPGDGQKMTWFYLSYESLYQLLVSSQSSGGFL